MQGPVDVFAVRAAVKYLLDTIKIPRQDGYSLSLANYQGQNVENFLGAYVGKHTFDLVDAVANKTFSFSVGRWDWDYTATLAWEYENTETSRVMVDLAEKLNLPLEKRNAITLENKTFNTIVLKLYGHTYEYTWTSSSVWGLTREKLAAVAAINALQTRADDLGGPVALENIGIDSIDSSNPLLIKVNLTEPRPRYTYMVYQYTVFSSSLNVAMVNIAFRQIATSNTINLGSYRQVNVYALEAAFWELSRQGITITDDLMLRDYSHTNFYWAEGYGASIQFLHFALDL